MRVASLLELLVTPAVGVMNRLSYGKKFVLIGVLLSIPFVAILHLQFSIATERVELNEKERAGVAYIAAARDVLHALQRRRVLAVAIAAGDASLSPAFDEATRAADAAALRLDAIDAREGGWLRTSSQWKEIRGSWEKLKASNAQPIAKSDWAHGRLGELLSTLIFAHAGTYSNLLLDPDLDSYWLMDAIVVKLPALSETVTTVCAVALRPLSWQTETDRAVRLAVGHESALATARALDTVNMTTAFRETSRYGNRVALEAALDEPMNAVLAKVSAYGDAVKPWYAGATPWSPAEKDSTLLVARTLDALEQIYVLYERIEPELDNLIANRAAAYRTQRTQGIAAAMVAAVVLTYLFCGFYLSVRNAVAALSDATLQVTAGERFLAATSRDELGQLATSYLRAQNEKIRLLEQLRHADKLATIGYLAAGTAHELNEPLGSILGFAQLAMKCPDTPGQVERDLKKIARAALHAREIVKQLMLYARQTPPNRVPSDLNALVVGALDMLSPRCERQGVRLVRKLAPELPPITLDVRQMQQVVLNVVVNSIQATQRGGTVVVSTAAGTDDVAIIVTDYGSGMSERVKEEMFHPFFTTKDVGEGTGLGLSVVHGIVTSHGGSLRVESALGRGTRFEVHLPFVSEAVSREPRTSQSQ